MAVVAQEMENIARTIDKRFSKWLSEQRTMGVEFNQEQLNWLEKMKNHIAESVEITKEDFEYAPFDTMGGLGKANKIFGDKFDSILKSFSEELIA